ncbi:hypothetical protein AB0B40_01385 [Streptomyces sp. NPDC042638]|uniref:hypothetical protein n=1 Tax=Streptomyces sp. NPDC042638 TaxID=3154333 RepID=UPI0033C276FE
MWKNATGYGAGSKPSKSDYAPGSWVIWTTPNGRRRMGIVSDDPFTLAAVKRSAQVGQTREAQCKAVVIPADGGDVLPLSPKSKKHPQAVIKDGGRWRPVRAHNQTNSQKAQAA